MNIYKSRKLIGNKFWEVQFEIPTHLSDWFCFKIELTSKRDHAGFRFEIELLKLFYFHLWIYDSRHWNHDENRWEIYVNE
jgi:hypothetical protein